MALRPGFNPQLRAPKGVARQDHFYDVAGELPREDNDMERFYGETETIAAPHLEKLRSGNIRLTPQEKSELATFISLVRTRTRSYREQVNTIASKMQVLMGKETLETEGGGEDLIQTNVGLVGERLRWSRCGLGPRSVAADHVSCIQFISLGVFSDGKSSTPAERSTEVEIG